MSIFGLEINAIFIIAQIAGFAAMGVVVMSYQMKHRASIIAMQIFSNLLWILHYLLLGSYSAVVANSIGTVRNVLYGVRGKYKFADSKLIPSAFIVIFVISGIITYKNIFDVLPMIAMIIASIAFFIEDEKIIRILSVPLSSLWLIYAIRNVSIAGMVSESLVLISVIVAIIRYHGFDLYEKTAKDYSSCEKSEGKANDEN